MISKKEINSILGKYESRKITKSRLDFYRVNLTIEFKINSNDPDILNITILSPGNIIKGFLIYSYIDFRELIYFTLPSWDVTQSVEIGGDPDGDLLIIMPYNQTIIFIRKYSYACPFK